MKDLHPNISVTTVNANELKLQLKAKDQTG